MASSVRSLLFSDIEGSSDLLRRAGPQYRDLLNLHRRIVREELALADGVEHGTEGDSFFVSFEAPTEALRAAVSIQRRLESNPWPDELRLRIRVGIHIGEVIDNAGDLIGMAVHHAARLAGCAHGGQIVVSEAFRAMTTQVPDDVELVPLGPYRVRDMGTVEVFQVVHPQLQHTFPALRGTLSGRTNLPQTPTAFVGGRDEIDELRRQVERSPLLTLTGPGGVGKTRRAIELGRSCMEQFNGGVWMVELAEVRELEAVMPTIAATLSIRQQPHVSLRESIVDWCRDRRLMLIIDNCEHLLESVREVVLVMVARCPSIELVTTSREPLGVAGERVHPVQVLSADVDALALFVDRASAADSSFVLSDAERALVVEICRRLDGLPLAIELAAARVRSMAPADLLKRLDNRLELLRGGAGAAERQATGRAAVAWSYQLLADRGQLLFDRLSVFAGGFDLDAAEAVCADDGLSGSEVFDLLSGLVDKSMVMADRELGGARYRLLETMRLFGHENLVAAGDLDPVRARHLLHFRLLAERTDRSFRGASQTIGAIVFGREWDNLRVAHQWAVHTHDIDSAERLLGATRLFAESLNRVEQGEWAERILAIGTEQRPPQPDIYAQAAYWAFMDENSERYFDLLDRGIELLSSLDDADATLCLAFAVPNEHPRAPHPYEHFEIAASKLDLAVEWWALLALEENGAIFNYPNASHYRARVVEMAAQVQAPTLMVAADLLTGHELIVASDRDAAGALECYRSALRIAQLSGDAMSEASCLRAIALATTLAEPSRAIEACRDALVAVYDIRQWIRIWQLFESIAMCCVRLERLEAVAVIVGYLKSHWEPSGLEEQLGFRAFTRNALDAHPELQSSLKRGAAMNRYEIVGFALTELQQMLDAASP